MLRLRLPLAGPLAVSHCHQMHWQMPGRIASHGADSERQPDAAQIGPGQVTQSFYCTSIFFSYPDSIRTRARRFLRCIPSQVCFEPLTRTRTVVVGALRQPLAVPLQWQCLPACQ
jgi:hypothetical protein